MIRADMDRLHDDGELAEKTMAFHAECVMPRTSAASMPNDFVMDYCREKFQFNRINIEWFH